MLMKIDKKLLLLMALYALMVSAYIYLYYAVRTSPIYIGPSTNNVEHWGAEVSSCLTLKKCNYDEKKRNIILLVDSHAMQLLFGFEESYPDHNIIILSGEIFNDDWYQRQGFDKEKEILAFLVDNLRTGDLLVLAVAQHHALVSGVRKLDKSSKITEILDAIITNVTSTQSDIVLFKDTPRLAIDLPIALCKKQIGLQHKRFKCKDQSSKNGLFDGTISS